jgi:hypothetical protein
VARAVPSARPPPPRCGDSDVGCVVGAVRVARHTPPSASALGQPSAAALGGASAFCHPLYASYYCPPPFMSLLRRESPASPVGILPTRLTPDDEATRETSSVHELKTKATLQRASRRVTISLCSRLGTGAQCKKKNQFRHAPLLCAGRDQDHRVGRGEQGPSALSAPSNSQPFARHVRRRCVREFERAG